MQNKLDKGAVKNEMNQRSNIFHKTGLALLIESGIEVTHKFEIIRPSNNLLKPIVENLNMQPNNSNKRKLFISHSSEDDIKIKPFIKLLNLIGLHDQIFYCSIPGYGLKAGEHLFDGLKRELSNDVFALFMLSPNFYKSQVCLCEMGAVWIKSQKHIPVLIPPTTFSDMGGVFPNDIALKLNDKFHMNQIKDDLQEFFYLPQINSSRWEQLRDDYLNEVNLLLD